MLGNGKEEMIDQSYNRYSFFDDMEELPEWFVEDEKRAYKPNKPITKEEVEAHREELKEFNSRPTKKVAEAMARKKMRAIKQANKIRKKANAIAK